MSNAKKCDRCGTFFEEERGCLTVDAHVVEAVNSPDDVRCVSWSNVDFCKKCSAEVLKAMHPAIDEVTVHGELA